MCSNKQPGKNKLFDADDPSIHNGLITKIWGPHGWEFFHSITFGYPLKPTDQEKQDYLEYFTIIGKVFPCRYCRDSYQKFITDGDTILNMKTMESRETLTRWAYRLHNRVNNKLGTDYGTTYEEMYDKYESYRARCTHTEKGCLMPLDIKAESYKKAEIQTAPIINVEYARMLIKHANDLGLHNYEYHVDRYNNIRDKQCDLWKDRNKKCRTIIKYMRKKGINSLDINGLPTLEEMMLMSMLSSTLEHHQLETIKEIVSKFP